MLNISKLKFNNLNNKSLMSKGELNNDISYLNLTKQWINSIYHFYRNNEKNIPVLDTLTYEIISNYFNMYSSKLERSIFLRKKSVKRRRYKLNKILVSKPEFKHTNDKVKITLYVYNTELTFLNIRMKNLKKRILAQYFNKIYTTKYITLSKLYLVKSLLKRVNILKSNIEKLKALRNKFLNKYIIGDNKLLSRKTIINYYQEWSYLKYLTSLMHKRRLLRVGKALNRFEKNTRKIRNLFNKNINKGLNKALNNSKLIDNYVQVKYLNKSIKIVKFLSLLFNKLNNNTYKNTINLYSEQINNMPMFSISKKVFTNKIRKLIFRLKLLFRYNNFITFNKLKFNTFIEPLRFFLEKIYKKDVEFDIVTVKNYRLNSNLLTQVMAIKLRNRKAKLLRVINKIYYKIKLPILKKYDYLKKIHVNKYRQNTIIRKYLNKSFIFNKPLISFNILNKITNKDNTNIQLKRLFYNVNKGDKLDLLLKSINTKENTLNVNNLLNEYKYTNKNILLERNLENVVLDKIDNKSISGIRIEASGRLTKRIVAARSISKIRQKGTMKNINSSYKNLSTLLLRGNLNSNTQFTKTNSKTRIGSFGLKGWISSI